MTFKKVRAWFGCGILGLIVVGTLWEMGVGSFCFLHLGLVRLICPIGFFEICLSNRKIYWDLVPALLIVMGLVILVGRMFCSWACPVAFIFDWFYKALNAILPAKFNGFRVRVKMIVVRKLPNLGAKDGIALLAGAFAGIAIFGYPVISTFCPIGVFTRNAISFAAHFTLHGDLLLLPLVALVGCLFVNGWRDCCPAGMLCSVVAKTNRFFVPEVNKEKCTLCGTCENICPAHLCLSKKNYDTSICCKCLRCIDNCPNQALHLAGLPVSKRERPVNPENIR
ncbi:MAG: 4Fe-4S binding protein [Deltaproteobacteria bacterium]|nr:4Fe-4S binding protein [Deltaproteobacteria bacterium]